MSISVTFTIGGFQEDAEAFKERMRQDATKAGMSLSEWIVEACAEYLRSKP